MTTPNYTLGRGELHFAQFLPGTQTPGGERYFGNSPEFSATIESENLDHYNSDRGIREKDASVPLQVNRSASFSTDNISPENLALFFFGSKTALTVVGATITDEVIGPVEQGLGYQLGVTPTNPVGARGLDDATAVIVKDSEVAPTTFVVNTDYTIDYKRGRVVPVVGGNIDNDTVLKVTYKTKSSTRSRIISGSTPIEGMLKYISYNPVGEQFDWTMPYVKISPNGDFALKGEEFQVIPFNVEILKKATLEAIYIDGEPLLA